MLVRDAELQTEHRGLQTVLIDWDKVGPYQVVAVGLKAPATASLVKSVVNGTGTIRIAVMRGGEGPREG